MPSASATSKAVSDGEFEETFVTNLRYAADRLEREGVLALVEAVNARAKPGYWLSDPAKAERIVRRVNHPNLRLQFDVFHAQIVGGDLTRRIEDWAPIIGHVQIAQVQYYITLEFFKVAYVENFNQYGAVSG